MMQDKFELFLRSFRAGTLTDDERAEFADEVEAMRAAEDNAVSGFAFIVNYCREGDYRLAHEEAEKRFNRASAGFLAAWKQGDA